MNPVLANVGMSHATNPAVRAESGSKLRHDNIKRLLLLPALRRTRHAGTSCPCRSDALGCQCDRQAASTQRLTNQTHHRLGAQTTASPVMLSFQGFDLNAKLGLSFLRRALHRQGTERTQVLRTRCEGARRHRSIGPLFRCRLPRRTPELLNSSPLPLAAFKSP